MGKTKVLLEIKKRRTFSEEFKKSKVNDLISKRVSIIELSKMHGVSRTALYKWLYRYSVDYQRKPILVVQMESEEQKTKHLMHQVAELERIIGQKQLEIDFLNKLMEIGSEELGFDLKKNFSVQLYSGTGDGPSNTPTK